MKFILTGGPHVDDNARKGEKGKTVMAKRGSKVESDLELDVLFPNKFKRVGVLSKAKAPTADTDEYEEEDGDPEAKPDYGVDITTKVKTAKDAGLKVFKSAKGTFTVFDEDLPDTPLKHDLPDKPSVLAFIKEHTS